MLLSNKTPHTNPLPRAPNPQQAVFEHLKQIIADDVMLALGAYKQHYLGAVIYYITNQPLGPALYIYIYMHAHTNTHTHTHKHSQTHTQTIN